MNKKEFAKILSELVAIKKDEKNLNKAFKKFNPDWNYISFGRYETLVVDTLSITMNDEAYWINYFLYERNCKFTKKTIITDAKGKKLPFENYDDLYNLIKKQL